MSGKIDRLTFALAKSYGIKSDVWVRKAQLILSNEGLLQKSGRTFIAAIAA